MMKTLTFVVLSAWCGLAWALPSVNPADAWPSVKTAQLKEELVGYARSHGHAHFAAKIAAETNTTDWIGETLAYGTRLLKSCEGRDFRDAERRTALEIIDYPFHVDNYDPRYTTAAETNAWALAIRDHLAAARERILREAREAKVPEGSLRLWHIYNMAYLVKGPRHAVLLDLSKRPYIGGLWTDKDFAAFAELADVFVVTHPHRDHYCPEILQAFLARKKPVVLPCDLKLNDPNARVLDQDHLEPLEIGGIKVRNFLGHQGKGVPCNVYWMEIDGVRLADNGDNYVKEQERRIATCPPVDVIISSTWNLVTNMVASCAAAPGFDCARAVFLPSHENELGHSVAHREGYRRMYANPYRLATPDFAWPRTIPLHWGESVTVGIETYSPHDDMLKAFLALPQAERRAKFMDADYRKNVFSGPAPKIDGHRVRTGHQRTVPLAWNGDAKAKYTVRVADKDTGTVAFEQTVKGPSCRVDSLEIGRTYNWSAENGGTTNRGEFAIAAEPPRLVYLPSVGNSRDLGGWVGLDGRRVRQGRIYRSAMLESVRNGKRFTKVKPEDAEVIVRRYGIRTELDLRSGSEVTGIDSSVLGPTVKWVNIHGGFYSGVFCERGHKEIREIFTLLLDESRYPILYHCAAGQDRTGTLSFLLNGLLGVSEDDLFKDWEMSGMANPRPNFVHEKCIDKFVGPLKQTYPAPTIRESCEKLVRDCGVTDEEIARFRKLMLEPEH